MYTCTVTVILVFSSNNNCKGIKLKGLECSLRKEKLYTLVPCKWFHYAALVFFIGCAIPRIGPLFKLCVCLSCVRIIYISKNFRSWALKFEQGHRPFLHVMMVIYLNDHNHCSTYIDLH